MIIKLSLLLILYLLYAKKHMNQTEHFLGQKLRNCLSDQTEKDDFEEENVENYVQDCVRTTTALRERHFIRLNVGFLNEIKYILPIRIRNEMRECYWLTVGIGNTTQAEKEFGILYPKCKIFGTEAGKEYADFGKYGYIIPYGLNTNNEDAATLSLLDSDATYKVKSNFTNTITLDQLLATYMNNARCVDIATFDTEGHEYLLLSKVFSQNAVNFCQIDIELHNKKLRSKLIPDKTWTFKKFWIELLSSAYLPVRAERLFGLHHKITVINSNRKECAENLHLTKYFPVVKESTMSS